MKFGITEEKKVMLRNIIGAALEDQSFKARLMENPEAAIGELYPGYKAGKSIVVVDQTNDLKQQYLNVSRMSYAALGGNTEELDLELTEEELELIAGGWSCLFWSCDGGGGIKTGDIAV